MCASEARASVMTIKDPKKLRALLKTADCGEFYSKINGELEFNVGYYSKHKEEKKIKLSREDVEAVLKRLEHFLDAEIPETVRMRLVFEKMWES